MYELPKINLDYLVKLTDNTGIFQHANGNVPNPDWGYCTDDVSRALVTASLYQDELERRGDQAIIDDYIDFLKRAQLQDGTFRNFLGTDGKWSNKDNPGDSLGRSMWSLGVAYSLLDEPQNSNSKRLLDKSLSSIAALDSIRNKAYAILGLSRLTDPKIRPVLEQLTRSIADEYHQNEGSWFEPELTYDNARLSQAMLLAGSSLSSPEYTSIGVKSLGFLTKKIIRRNGIPVLIGNERWIKPHETQSPHGQQPIDAGSHVEALSTAEETLNIDCDAEKNLIFSWFLGNNTAREPLYDETTGSCKDGIQNGKLNHNRGAESTLAYLLARRFME